MAKSRRKGSVQPVYVQYTLHIQYTYTVYIQYTLLYLQYISLPTDLMLYEVIITTLAACINTPYNAN